MCEDVGQLIAGCRARKLCAVLAELSVLSAVCYMAQSARPILAIVLWVARNLQTRAEGAVFLAECCFWGQAAELKSDAVKSC